MRYIMVTLLLKLHWGEIVDFPSLAYAARRLGPQSIGSVPLSAGIIHDSDIFKLLEEDSFNPGNKSFRSKPKNATSSARKTHWKLAVLPPQRHPKIKLARSFNVSKLIMEWSCCTSWIGESSLTMEMETQTRRSHSWWWYHCGAWRARYRDHPSSTALGPPPCLPDYTHRNRERERESGRSSKQQLKSRAPGLTSPGRRIGRWLSLQGPSRQDGSSRTCAAAPGWLLILHQHKVNAYTPNIHTTT